MIERISPSRIAAPSAADARGVRAAPQAVADSARAVANTAPSLSNEPRRMAAEGPPIDGARVERFRAALANGSFTVDPERIAEAMIAAERGA